MMHNLEPVETAAKPEVDILPTEIASEPEVVGSDEAEYALHKFEALKLLNNDYANATFEEARQLFEQIKNENGDIPASVSFEYALINDLLLPAREKRDLSDRLKTAVSLNCSTLSWLVKRIYPFCSDRNKRSLSSSFRNMTDILEGFRGLKAFNKTKKVLIDKVLTIPKNLRPVVVPYGCKFPIIRAQAQVLNPGSNDYRISPTPLIFMAVASCLGLLSSLVLICKAFCCKH